MKHKETCSICDDSCVICWWCKRPGALCECSSRGLGNSYKASDCPGCMWDERKGKLIGGEETATDTLPGQQRAVLSPATIDAVDRALDGPYLVRRPVAPPPNLEVLLPALKEIRAARMKRFHFPVAFLLGLVTVVIMFGFFLLKG